MKNLVMAVATVVIFLSAKNVYAFPDSPFYAGVLFGDTTLDIGAEDIYVGNGSPTDINTKLDVGKTQNFSMMLKGGFYFMDSFAVELQSTNSLKKDKIFGEVNNDNGPKSPLEQSNSTTGAFLVYHAGEDLFADLLFGAAKSDVTFSASYGEVKFSSADISYGIDVGQKLGIGSIAFSYMVYPMIKTSQADFKDVFATNSAEDRVTIKRYLHNSFLSMGYIVRF